MERLALFLAWSEQCAWCRRPIFFSEMEVEHVIPKSLQGQDLRDALTLHALGENYDLNALENLVPSCGPCNSGKGKRLAPATPAISLILTTAQERAPSIRAAAARFATRQAIEKAVEVVLANADPVLDQAALIAAGKQLDTELPEVTGTSARRLHPLLDLVLDPDRWAPVSGTKHAISVADGQTGGIIGSDPSFLCSRCGSHGPWNGITCLSCGNREAPD
ncbi:HNH endonuclease [Conexibacter stalactiti]|uniref:HNH endonuclease n=1 Tax=Conexibacter stalactiti TaxID=1940611 RepID=A0ABU4HL29_9ACTN|nr:HNH endonuclease [Conexibacter stalactiti]MDW5593407.1 HNH endonuclease [Conexibacter stalactiti]MEC5034048.1 HNH endonuclease [Conexibacter stalactiti]